MVNHRFIHIILSGWRSSSAPRDNPHVARMRPGHGSAAARPIRAPLNRKRTTRIPDLRGRSPSRQQRRCSSAQTPPLRQTRTPAPHPADSTLRGRAPFASTRSGSRATRHRTRTPASGNGVAAWPADVGVVGDIARRDGAAGGNCDGCAVPGVGRFQLREWREVVCRRRDLRHLIK